jgi:hypothetical protein
MGLDFGEVIGWAGPAFEVFGKINAVVKAGRAKDADAVRAAVQDAIDSLQALGDQIVEDILD